MVARKSPSQAAMASSTAASSSLSSVELACELKGIEKFPVTAHSYVRHLF
jgi:hypothetical protein